MVKVNTKTKSSNKISKGSSKPKKVSTKHKKSSKSTKIQIEKLNSNISTFTEITNLLATPVESPKEQSALDAKQLKQDIVNDEQLKQSRKNTENDLKKQMELLTEMGL